MCYDGTSYNIIDWNKKTELELFPLKLLSNRTIFEKRVKPIQAKNENGRINFRKIVKILETLSSGGGGGVSLKVIYPFEVFFFLCQMAHQRIDTVSFFDIAPLVHQPLFNQRILF